MADMAEVLLHLFEEERTQARQSEQQRATFTNILILVIAAGVGFIANQAKGGTVKPVLVVSIVVAVLGLLGAVISSKYFERWLRHWRRAYAYQAQLLDIYPEIDEFMKTFAYEPLSKRTDPYEREVEERFPRLSRLRLYQLWIWFHYLVVALGTAGALICVVILLVR
jgi:fatty acid desaturase